MSIEKIIKSDTHLNQVFCAVTCEPKALLFYEMYKEGLNMPASEISDLVRRTYGLDKDKYSPNIFVCYFSSKYIDFIAKSMGINNKSGRRIVKYYSFCGSDMLGKKIGHALYGASKMTCLKLTLRDIFSSGHREQNSGPFAVARILYFLNEQKKTTVRDLSEKTEIDSDQLINHLHRLDALNLVDLTECEEFCYRLNLRDDIMDITQKHAEELYLSPKVSRKTKDGSVIEYCILEQTAAQEILDLFLEYNSQSISFRTIKDKIKKRFSKKKSDIPFSEDVIKRRLYSFCNIGILERTGNNINGRICISKISEGIIIPELISPLITGQNLVAPSKSDVLTALKYY